MARKSHTNAKPYTLEERDGRTVRVYESGAVIDHATGRIVQPPAHTLMTAESATRLHAARQEQKRAAMMAGALRGTRDILQREPVHEYEWVEVIAEANMHRAADPDNVKGVDASRFLLQEASLSEARQAAEPTPQRVLHELSPETLALLRDIRDRQAVDAVAADVDE